MLPLIVGELPASMLPVFSKPFPVMAYVTVCSVMPGATSRLRPKEPSCS